jgi:hypothetical protein
MGMRSRRRTALVSAEHSGATNDIVDATVFHLVTRWTDREAFHTWHRSAAHRESHRRMPKGLRLDPSYTQLVELERIPIRGAPDVATAAVDAVAAVGAYLEMMHVVHVVRFALNGDIQMMNGAMASHLGLADAAAGGSVFDYLTETDASVVRQHLNGRSNAAAPLNLNFCDARGELSPCCPT